MEDHFLAVASRDAVRASRLWSGLGNAPNYAELHPVFKAELLQ
jgi:hypothetical protein